MLLWFSRRGEGGSEGRNPAGSPSRLPEGLPVRRLCLLTEGALVEVTSRLLGQLRHGLLD